MDGKPRRQATAAGLRIPPAARLDGTHSRLTNDDDRSPAYCGTRHELERAWRTVVRLTARSCRLSRKRERVELLQGAAILRSPLSSF
jgi:hypothetical protein